MEENNINKHLRAALSEIIALEKTRLHQLYDNSDEKIKQRVKKMVPIVRALNVLKEEVGEVKGIVIGTAPHGHMATVRLSSLTSNDNFSISTNCGNTKYSIERRRYYDFEDGGIYEEEYDFDDASEVLKLVIDAIGKHIASVQVLDERKK
jgi:hypothetical protein